MSIAKINTNMKVIISDPTLRDGNHAVKHQLNIDQIAAYCKAANNAGIGIVEVGHGNGLGASSLQLGEAKTSDYETLKTARTNLSTTKLGIHVIPGFATIDRDLKPAIDQGVDVVRVAAHCSEADICERHITYARKNGTEVWGCLMMSHMVSPNMLLEQARKMESYGAQGVVLMDSAGHFLPEDVSRRVKILNESLLIPIGFHGHNNLGSAVGNSLAAINAGATLLDACARGFGAGAGNTQLEVLVAVLNKLGWDCGVDLYKMLDAAELAEEMLVEEIPSIKSTSIISGLSGVFSGFNKPVLRISNEFKVDPRDVFLELGRRKIVAGQEDLILEVAKDLAASVMKGNK